MPGYSYGSAVGHFHIDRFCQTDEEIPGQKERKEVLNASAQMLAVVHMLKLWQIVGWYAALRQEVLTIERHRSFANLPHSGDQSPHDDRGRKTNHATSTSKLSREKKQDTTLSAETADVHHEGDWENVSDADDDGGEVSKIIWCHLFAVSRVLLAQMSATMTSNEHNHEDGDDDSESEIALTDGENTHIPAQLLMHLLAPGPSNAHRQNGQ